MITLYDEISFILLHTEQHKQSTTIRITGSSNMLVWRDPSLHLPYLMCSIYLWSMLICESKPKVYLFIKKKSPCLFTGLGLHHSMYMNYFYNVFMNILKHGGMNFPRRTEISPVSLKTSSLVFWRWMKLMGFWMTWGWVIHDDLNFWVTIPLICI